MGKRSTCVLKEAPLNKGPLGLPKVQEGITPKLVHVRLLLPLSLHLIATTSACKVLLSEKRAPEPKGAAKVSRERVSRFRERERERGRASGEVWLLH